MSHCECTRPEILQFHRLYSVGNSIKSISRQTGRTRNTIAAHLRGQHQYDAELQRKIERIMSYTSRRVPAPRQIDGWLTLEEACLLIPWRPSRSRLYDACVRTGMLRTKLVDGVTCTRPQWVAHFVRKALGRDIPRGLGVYRRHAACLLDSDTPAEFHRALPAGFQLRHNRQPVVMLWDVRRAADATGGRFIDRAPVLSAFVSLAEHQFALILPGDLPRQLDIDRAA